jgi:hypothetical protein
MVDASLFTLADVADDHIFVDGDRIIIDGFYRDPDAIRRLALAQTQWEPRRHFPGLQAVVAVDTDVLFAGLRRYIDIDGISTQSESAHKAMFSMVTKKDAELAPHQSQSPHADSHSSLAGLVYLNLPDQCRGGTSFYRHRQTGLESQPRTIEGIMAAIGETKMPQDQSGIDALYQRYYAIVHAPTNGPRQYIRESNEHWELISLVEMKYNRAVFYDSQLFHSNYTRDDFFGDTMETRRLTQTLFLIVE